MLVVETVAKIRRDHDRGKPIKAIVRETGLTRNTVRKAVRAESAQFSYRRSANYRKRCLAPVLGVSLTFSGKPRA